jgi:hypothetical protein
LYIFSKLRDPGLRRDDGKLIRGCLDIKPVYEMRVLINSLDKV